MIVVYSVKLLIRGHTKNVFEIFMLKLRTMKNSLL